MDRAHKGDAIRCGGEGHEEERRENFQTNKRGRDFQLVLTGENNKSGQLMLMIYTSVIAMEVECWKRIYI